MKKYNILIVDDEIINIKIAGEIFKQREDFQIFSAENGQKALKIVKSKKFDLILLDIVLPDIDGYEICKIIKDDTINSEVPIIFVTAKYDDEKSIVKAFECGAHDYIKKPFQRNEFLARVEHTLELYDVKNNLEQLVEDKTKSLNNKIAALEEMYDLVKTNEENLFEKISEKIDLTINPVLSKIKNKLDIKDRKLFEIVENNLKDLVGPFNNSIRNIRKKLTPRECEIFELIRNNMSSKEIANLLNITLASVKFHRTNIRRKLDIDSKNVNLQMYLSNL